MSDATGRDDQVLVAAIQRGDHDALDALVLRYHGPLCLFLERMLGDPETAADVTQETFLRMIRALPRYQPRAKFSTWLYTIATNLARDRLRRGRTRLDHERPLDDPEREDDLAEPEVGVADQALGRVQREEIRKALADLSADHRTVILLHYFQGLSYKEIAAVCGCTTGTVGSRLHYAVRHLRRRLGEGEEEL